MSPFLIPWSPRLLRPLTAPSRVPRSLPGSNNDSKSVLVRRPESDGYVAPCCWRRARRISAALPRNVGGFEGSEEVRRIERRGGRIWCSYIIQSSVVPFTSSRTKEKRRAERTYIGLHEQSLVLNERMDNPQQNFQAGPAVRICIRIPNGGDHPLADPAYQVRQQVLQPGVVLQRGQCSSTFCLLVRRREKSSSETRVVHLQLSREHVLGCLAFASCTRCCA